MNDRQLAELVRRYQQHLAHTGSTLAASAGSAWDQLTSWDEADVADLTALLQPAAAAAAAHAANLAVGFIALTKQLRVVPVGPSTVVDWSPAFVAYWHSLGVADWESAQHVGRNRVEALGFDAVQSEARATSVAVDQREPSITRWARVPDGGACDWCVEVAGNDFHSAESADFGHSRCGCAVVPA